LHDGHVSLLRQAQSLSTRVVVSVFVNPMQFETEAAFEAYPRKMEADEKLLTENGCDLLFAPSVDTMFPNGFATKIDPGPMATILEGVQRPKYFKGMATVITKLLLQVMPDYMFLGERDYQQYRLIEQVVTDLQIPVGLVPVPVYRDEDGLAISNWSQNLSDEERVTARILPQTLELAVEDIRAGHDIDATLLGGREQLDQAGFQVDYMELVDVRSLMPVRDLRRPARLLVSVRLGDKRLMDNMVI
jgi:pantoate--beta-alanine ligase